MTVFYAVEDQLSRSVAERLISDIIGSSVEATQLGKKVGGFAFIKKNLSKYTELSQRDGVIVLTDLDDSQCAPELRAKWFRSQGIGEPLPTGMVFCIAVREIETWLLSDRENVAGLLGISAARIDRNVEENIANPKEYLLTLVRNSRKHEIRRQLLPAARSQARVGLSYNYTLSDFARTRWNPSAAAETCVSLRRAITRIDDLARSAILM